MRRYCTVSTSIFRQYQGFSDVLITNKFLSLLCSPVTIVPHRASNTSRAPHHAQQVRMAFSLVRDTAADIILCRYYRRLIYDGLNTFHFAVAAPTEHSCYTILYGTVQQADSLMIP